MVKNTKEAESIVLKERQGMRVLNTVELEKCFVVNVVPEDFNEQDGMFIGGGTRVDKKTGLVQLYNPMIEDLR
jgi:hypothetical protein